MCVCVCVFVLVCTCVSVMHSTVDLDVGRPNIAIKDVNIWTANRGDFFFIVVRFYDEADTLFWMS